MAKVTIQFTDQEVTYSSKKEMLKQVGRAILSRTDEPMTLRQLYYRFVAADLVDNKQSQYQYLSESIKDARIEGTIPWDWIEDRTRSTDGGDKNLVSVSSRFNGNLEWFKETPERYELPRWKGQDDYVEVWVEKEALAGVFASACSDLNVVTFPNRGYTSITLLKQAADRMKDVYYEKGRDITILYFGDFDPSGQDIERNIRDKLRDTFDVPVTVDRKALTRDQIDRHELPPQPAKKTDSRYETFVENHGDIAVELDALPPEELRSLIRDSVDEYFDYDHYENEVLPKQNKRKRQLRKRIDNSLVDNE